MDRAIRSSQVADGMNDGRELLLVVADAGVQFGELAKVYRLFRYGRSRW